MFVLKSGLCQPPYLKLHSHAPRPAVRCPPNHNTSFCAALFEIFERVRGGSNRSCQSRVCEVPTELFGPKTARNGLVFNVFQKQSRDFSEREPRSNTNRLPRRNFGWGITEMFKAGLEISRQKISRRRENIQTKNIQTKNIQTREKISRQAKKYPEKYIQTKNIQTSNIQTKISRQEISRHLISRTTQISRYHHILKKYPDLNISYHTKYPDPYNKQAQNPRFYSKTKKTHRKNSACGG